jgi:hypothetical protein
MLFSIKKKAKKLWGENIFYFLFRQLKVEKRHYCHNNLFFL